MITTMNEDFYYEALRMITYLKWTLKVNIPLLIKWCHTSQ